MLKIKHIVVNCVIAAGSLGHKIIPVEQTGSIFMVTTGCHKLTGRSTIIRVLYCTVSSYLIWLLNCYNARWQEIPLQPDGNRRRELWGACCTPIVSIAAK
jgi:hypothetical protein